MNHGDHAGHGGMDHSNMGHDRMDHSSMGHSDMDHSSMDHGDHSGHDMAMAMVNTTMKAVMEVLQPEKAMDHSGRWDDQSLSPAATLGATTGLCQSY